MTPEFHTHNREAIIASLPEGSMLVMFSGKAPRKTADEDYPFYADRSFVYMTGLHNHGLAYSAIKTRGTVEERLWLLPPDAMVERWTGVRVKADEATAISGIENISYIAGLEATVKRAAATGAISKLYLDFDRITAGETYAPEYALWKTVSGELPYLSLGNIRPAIALQRTIKTDEEIAAMRVAEEHTHAGIAAMMSAVKPGIYEYQLKSIFEHTLAMRGSAPSFPPIISAGRNNFCIHYYSYAGKAEDGDLVLCDVGAFSDDHGTDVSRPFPVNGKFSDRQRALYECAYATSEHMFATLKPGLPMPFVDAEIRRYNFERLRDIGLVKTFDEVGKYMWHGGAHHVGYDTHDIVDASLPLTPGMVFCVDVGIYVEEWGIGFRLEDNCLITPDGCENLSACTPRKLEDIENHMR